MISDTAALALREALVSRGPNRGKLKASAPPSHTLAYAAWQGAMMSCNPYKVSIAGMLLFTPEQRTVHEEVTALFDTMPMAERIKFDRDRLSLESLGIW